MPDTRPERCPVCGAVSPLHAVRVAGRSDDGAPKGNEFVYMCPSCHQRFDEQPLRGLEFEIIVADLMQASPDYTDVRLGAAAPNTELGRRFQPDIVAKDAAGTTMVVECKSYQVLTPSRVRDEVARLSAQKTDKPEAHFVLALPARLEAEQRAQAATQGIDVWDLDELVRRFGSLIDGVTHPVLRPLLKAVAAVQAPGAAETPEALLIRELALTEPGHDGWHAYQKLIGRVLERLFCPPLSTPLLDRADEDDVNRRDIILPNYADSGFWAFVRQRYAADFIVVDAKNYSGSVGKKEVLQLLNYLKPRGAGMLGIIVTRHGADSACLVTLRDHWTREGKLVLVLNDQHVIEMLRAREAGGPAEEVVRQCIEEFRLSL